MVNNICNNVVTKKSLLSMKRVGNYASLYKHNKHSFEVGSEVIQNEANNLTFLQLSTSTLPFK